MLRSAVDNAVERMQDVVQENSGHIERDRIPRPGSE